MKHNWGFPLHTPERLDQEKENKLTKFSKEELDYLLHQLDVTRTALFNLHNTPIVKQPCNIDGMRLSSFLICFFDCDWDTYLTHLPLPTCHFIQIL